MLSRVIGLITVVSACFLIILLQVTNPTETGPVGILAVLICAYLSSLGVVAFLLYGGSRIVVRFASFIVVKIPPQEMPFKRAYYFSTIIATAPIMLIGLQSVTAVQIQEVGLVLLFVVLGCLYIAKRT